MTIINVTTRISSDEEGTGREFAYKLTKVKVKVNPRTGHEGPEGE